MAGESVTFITNAQRCYKNRAGEAGIQSTIGY